ncbi:type II toxin-antitoxin system RelE/ParE family toxin [Devosia nitrariae]|uniref:Toxin n=1 Tax=Devosia nitrariae TaxID=2071872 RepID=A0ABQ5WAP8_9HYPH|nr:type II toxin-antitoxin system RelE/ParE family toxin [Devosia nitrariae]GLQ56813.1 hypothetical protein GCM10010862_40720 [Devosia nitrariae]
MKTNYRLTAQASRDLRGIYRKSAEQFGLAQADRYYDALFEAIRLLVDFPEAAPERDEIRPVVRAYPKGSHLIVYRVDSRGIEIVRVFHQSQDWINKL